MAAWDERGLRVVLLDNARRPLRELPPGRLTACKVTEELGGESSLTLSWVLGTSVPDVRAESRVLLRDGRGRWREYVAKGGARVRTSGQVREATLRAEASWQSDVRLSEPMPDGFIVKFFVFKSPLKLTVPFTFKLDTPIASTQ